MGDRLRRRTSALLRGGAPNPRNERRAHRAAAVPGRSAGPRPEGPAGRNGGLPDRAAFARLRGPGICTSAGALHFFAGLKQKSCSRSGSLRQPSQRKTEVRAGSRDPPEDARGNRVPPQASGADSTFEPRPLRRRQCGCRTGGPSTGSGGPDVRRGRQRRTSRVRSGL